MIYIVIACHFKNEDQLCETTVDRLEKVLCYADSKGDSILVTGDVPYRPGSSTLAGLMKRWLLLKGHPEESIHLLSGGVGTFSEARAACKLLNEGDKITVISSPWYFFQGRPIWKRRAKERSIEVSFLSVPNTGGWHTWLTYLVIGLVVRMTILVGCERVLEDYFYRIQSVRREGFTFDGCK